jgi:hypothetical protein
MSIDSFRSLLAAAACLSFVSCASAPGAAPSQAVAVEAQKPAAPKAAPRQWSPIERTTVEMSFISLAGCWQTQPRAVAATITDLMGRMLPEKEIVWGPAMHLPGSETPGGPSRLSDALALIARDRNTGEYFVVFRGTNTISAAEWLFQDFMVQRQVPWRDIQAGPAPEEALVSEGAARAVKMRLDLTPEKAERGEGKNFPAALIDILENSRGPCVMHFTGHSLGGLLAPAMALWLVDYLDAAARPELAAKLRLDVYGYAGPTAGNAAFAAYLESRVPALSRYVNPLDIAPRAWSEAAMRDLPSLYRPRIGMEPIVRSLYDLCVAFSRGKGYAQPGAAIAVPSRVVPTRGKLFLLEAAYQHAVPYLDMLEPERKAMILAEVIEPVAAAVQVRGAKPIELEELFMTGK